MKKPEFQFVKFMDEGTDNPIVNRLMLQFAEMLATNIIHISKEKQEELKKVLFDCGTDLLKAEKYFKKYNEVLNEAVNNIKSGIGFKIDKIAIQYDDPSLELQRLFEEFLIRCVITIRRIKRIAEIILDENLKDHKTFNKRLDELFANDNNYMKMLKEDRVWVKELIDIRGMVEHEELEITNFSVTVGEDGKINIYAPSLKKKKCAVVKYMEVILYNVFSYCEDFTAMLLSLKCNDMCRIVQLPEKLWPEHRGFKYILDLKEEIKKPIIEKQKDDALPGC